MSIHNATDLVTYNADDIRLLNDEEVNDCNQSAKLAYNNKSTYLGKKEDVDPDQIINLKRANVSNYAIALGYDVKLNTITSVMKQRGYSWDVKTKQYVLKETLEKERMQEQMKYRSNLSKRKKTTGFRVELTREAFNALTLTLQLQGDTSIEARNKLISDAILDNAPEGFKELSKALVIKARVV